MFFGIRYQVLLRNYITIILHHIGKMNGAFIRNDNVKQNNVFQSMSGYEINSLGT